MDISQRHPGVQDLLKFFAWQHLPVHLQAISAPVSLLAYEMVDRIDDSAELVAGLRKLLEAKDCFVRAGLKADS